MALRLGGLVVCGEIDNTYHYSVYGRLWLRGQEQPLLLRLTGDCDPDLAGRRFYFETRDSGSRIDVGADIENFDLANLAWQQIGVTGTMTAERRVKTADCSARELARRLQLGEPPPMQWKRCLYLEWFSQNGRVVLEIPDPLIDFRDEDELLDILPTIGFLPEDDAPLMVDADESDESESPVEPFSESGSVTEEFSPLADTVDDPQTQGEHADEARFDEGSIGIEADDPYGLFPADLQRALDAESERIDRAVDPDGGSQSQRELELMDELLAGGEGEPISGLFETPMKLPGPDQLSDDEVEGALKTLLAQLALYGIALDICEHFTPRDAYRLLVEDICRTQTAYPELRKTQWVQQFTTAEFCTACEAELEREFDEQQRPDNNADSSDDPGCQ